MMTILNVRKKGVTW